jgi:hypothetical protein
MNADHPSTLKSAGALSPDGHFYWDGLQWNTTISPDGAWRWNGSAWVPIGRSPIDLYASPRTLGVCVLLGVCVAVAFFQVFVFDAYQRTVIALGDQTITYTFDLAGLTSLLITSALFLSWFHRAYRNAIALGANNLQFSPGWAIGWWFVPVACFWMPYRAAVEIWKASADAAPTLISVWWVTWLLCLALVNVNALVSDPTASPSLLWPLASASVVVAAVLSILVVRSVSKRQDARWRQLASMTPVAGSDR